MRADHLLEQESLALVDLHVWKSSQRRAPLPTRGGPLRDRLAAHIPERESRAPGDPIVWKSSPGASAFEGVEPLADRGRARGHAGASGDPVPLAAAPEGGCAEPLP